MVKPRRPFKFWATAALSAAFSLFGLLFIVVGPDAKTRLTGAMCILFFGLGGFAYLGGPLLTRRGAGTVGCERVRTSAGLEPAFVFPTPRAKQVAMTVGAFGMAGGSAVLIVIGAGWAGIFCTVVFGLFFLFMLFTVRRPQRLILTPTRLVVSAAAGTAEVPWEAVEHAELYEMPAGSASVDMVGVDATSPDAVVWTRGGMLGTLGRRQTGYDLVVGADTFAGEGEDVIEAILAYRDDRERRRTIGDAREHGRLLEAIGASASPA